MDYISASEKDKRDKEKTILVYCLEKEIQDENKQKRKKCNSEEEKIIWNNIIEN